MDIVFWIFIIFCLLAIIIYFLTRISDSDKPASVNYPFMQSEAAAPHMKQSKPIEVVYHAIADEGGPSTLSSDDDVFNAKQQREEIMRVHKDRADIIEPASQRAKNTHGTGMGLPPHPLTSNGPQGNALNLSNDASTNPEAEANAQAHPENTPVPSAQLQNQAIAQATNAPKPSVHPGG